MQEKNVANNQQALFESIINFSDDAILSKTLDGMIMSWNKGAERLFGYKADEAVGKHISIIIPSDRTDEESDIIAEIKSGRVIKHYETERVRKDGSRVQISLTVSPLKDREGDIIGVSKIAHDITKRKQAEELYKKTEYRYQQVVENILDGLMMDDLEGKVVYANDQFLKLYGLNREDLKDLVLEDYVAPEYHAVLRDRHNRRVAGEEVPSTFEYEGLRKDGTRLWLEVRVCKVFEDGNVIGTQSAIRDITERKNAEQNLIKSEKIYRTIAANLPGAIITIIDVNNKFILAEGDGLTKMGYSKDEMENHSQQEALDTVAYELVVANRQKAFEGKNVTVDVTYKNQYLRTRYIPLYDEQNKVYAVLTISLDITDIKKAAVEIELMNESLERKVWERTLQLESANKELEAFSYSVSHDLRAPLRIINGYADILEKDNREKLDAESKRIIEIIMNNTRKMGRLIDELLNLARLGRKELVVQNTNMNELLSDVIDEQLQLSKKQVDISKEDLLPAICDSSLIRHVWNNLISNAIKYSAKKDDPRVEVRSFIKDNKVVYSVKDNGVGFNMEYSDKLFGVFQRLHKQSEFEGTGVGLALVQRIVAKHGGIVWADSEEDKGATFYFGLPIDNR